MTNLRFDNFYITGEFIKIDQKRIQMKKTNLLPLTKKEGRKYIATSSCKMLNRERKNAVKSAMFLFISSVHLCAILLADFSLFWLLDVIQFHERQKDLLKIKDVKMYPKVNIKGHGIVSDMIKDIINSFKVLEKIYDLDVTSCVPYPKMPNYDKYEIILMILSLCWILVFFEPYFLRIRQLVMKRHYPQRTTQRTVWLYNHILRKRISFVKFSRRHLRTIYLKNDQSMSTICDKSCCQKLRAKFNENDALVKCQNPGCLGEYCLSCYSDLKNICLLCMEPLPNEILSDMSDEVDSSENEAEENQKKAIG
ncbi:unnamed protein product [Diamesa serratosioi]